MARAMLCRGVRHRNLGLAIDVNTKGVRLASSDQRFWLQVRVVELRGCDIEKGLQKDLHADRARRAGHEVQNRRMLECVVHGKVHTEAQSHFVIGAAVLPCSFVVTGEPRSRHTQCPFGEVVAASLPPYVRSARLV